MTQFDPNLVAEVGEQEVPKRCAFCGVSSTVLAWRPLTPARVSSPMSQAAWFTPEPMCPVVDAKLTCASCRVVAYGWLVGGLTGTFVLLSGRHPLGDLMPW